MPRVLSPCGTTGAYRRHLKKRETPCQPCKDAANAAFKAYSAKVRQRDGLSPTQKYRKRPELVVCHYCGTALKFGSSPNSEGVPRCKPCGRERHAIKERNEARRRRAEAKLAKAAQGTASKSRQPWVVGECAECLTYFTRRGQASRFCSTMCSRRARRSWKIATRDRLAIYVRDSWTCQLCMEPVDPDLMASDPMNDWAPSLDHIEPQSWVLVPDHSPSNLRLAHRWCNAVRGDCTYYTDADLRVA